MTQEIMADKKTKAGPVLVVIRLLALFVLLMVMFLLFAALVAKVSESATLDDVKARGKLNCGMNTGLEGFSLRDDKGVWKGFNVDFCRAIAAATLGDPDKVDYVPLNNQERFEALSAKKIDVLIGNTTWTMERETTMPLRFVGVNYIDGQGFLVPKSLGVNSVVTMSQAAICFVSGSTSQSNVEDYFRERDLTFTPVVFTSSGDMVAAYDAGKCDAMTGDQSTLYALRLKLKKPEEHFILNDVISKEPLGLAIHQGDDQWFNITRWVLFALVNAEELDVAGNSVDDLAQNSKKPAVLRLLGVEGDLGKAMGLRPDWAALALKAVGNYGEIFKRNLGKDSRLKIERGQNALWNAGGLIYVPQLR